MQLKVSVSRAEQYLQEKCSRRLFTEYKALRKRYWVQPLRARGYLVASIGKLADEIWKEYIKSHTPPEPDNDFTAA